MSNECDFVTKEEEKKDRSRRVTGSKSKERKLRSGWIGKGECKIQAGW